MAASKRLVLDANILIRAVLGARVRSMIEAHCERVAFFAASESLEEAEKYLGDIAAERGIAAAIWREALARVMAAVQTIPLDGLEPAEVEARARIGVRDPDDWPTLAAALLLECPIWTEDRDFFGSGVPTWTTATVEALPSRTLIAARPMSKLLDKAFARAARLPAGEQDAFAELVLAELDLRAQYLKAAKDPARESEAVAWVEGLKKQN